MSGGRRGGGGGRGRGGSNNSNNNSNTNSRGRGSSRSSSSAGRGRGGGGGGTGRRSSNPRSRGGGAGGRGRKSSSSSSSSRREVTDDSSTSVPTRRGDKHPNHEAASAGSSSNNSSSSGKKSSTSMLRDEDVLIAFMPYLKSNHAEATRIHENYQQTNNQTAFLKAARAFLERQQQQAPQQQQKLQQEQQVPQQQSPPPPSSTKASSPVPPPTPVEPTLPPPSSSSAFSSFTNTQQIPNPTTALFGNSTSTIQQQQQLLQRPDPPGITQQHAEASHMTPPRPHDVASPARPTPSQQQQQQQPPPGSGSQKQKDIESVQQGLQDLWKADSDTNKSTQPPHQHPTIVPQASIWSNAMGGGAAPSLPSASSASTPPPPPPQRPAIPSNHASNAASGSMSPDWMLPPPQQQQQMARMTLPSAAMLSPATKSTSSNGVASPALSARKEAVTPEPTSSPRITMPTPTATTTTTTPAKTVGPAPKRLWTHFQEQPGRILVNGVSGQDPSLSLDLGPRQQLTAHWSLPLHYIQSQKPNAKTIDEALQGLMVGLFRRGCTENGTTASIISKSVTGTDNSNASSISNTSSSSPSRSSSSFDYWRDPNTQSVRGRVPFYSPRTPGHVIFRLYWHDDPVYTLAIGPSLHVRVTEPDFESSTRFILSNFKAKKSNPTSLSALHSLAAVLETYLSRPNDGAAARATWGCIQEARKVVDMCFQEYIKTCTKLSLLEESVEELKQQVEQQQQQQQQQEEEIESGKKLPEVAVPDVNVQAIETTLVENGEAATTMTAAAAAEPENVLELREKTKALLGGRASNERKWRDSQLAFASILRAIVTNPTIHVLLKRESIAKLRLEFELWCPLSEEFAIASETAQLWFEPLQGLSRISEDDFREYAHARVKMQQRTLAFEPNTFALEDVLFPRNRGLPNQRTMDPGAVSVFNSMSTAMGHYYQKLYENEDMIVRQRELIRQRTEKCVQECGAFPSGTRVVIFGSSANGFGSPKSDIDMCLQLPDGARLGEDDTTGAEAMAKLAAHFEETGMKSVDTCRLTARIPIIMYHCSNPLSETESEDDMIECDISMHNPLAVLNTGYLRCYAEITPVVRVLASIVKRWAKARNINNPSGHTLSSYGYIIMLLHFLTYHKRAGNGLISPVAPPEGNPQYRTPNAPQPAPILPNLHWMDPVWPTLPKGTPYREISSLPLNVIDHPLVGDKKVNTYFCRPDSPDYMALLQMHFPGQDLSLAILLASFFRYYAYEFDYKRYVVSLHSTAARGVVEREVKAELDGWRNYSAALAIEDPFETFYDVAHVLFGGTYHRIRREFAVAYSKIADAASGRTGSWNKGDLRSMSGDELVDWLCEPLVDEKEQSPS